MNVKQINDALSRGALDEPGLFPHADEASSSMSVVFSCFILEFRPTQERRGVRLFSRVFPGSRLIVISVNQFETQAIKGVIFE